MNKLSISTDVEVSASINGQAVRRTVPARLSLADFLRDSLGLTGTHLGCEQGACGACTVLLDGRSVRSCLMLAAQAEGASVTTVEGLDDNPRARCLRTKMSEHHGLQCGFCTPGFMIAGHELLERHAQSAQAGEAMSETEVRQCLSGHVCRCTGYAGIIEAIVDASKVGEP
jgi:carbon-monoxide dehydrogenase small subunit